MILTEIIYSMTQFHPSFLQLDNTTTRGRLRMTSRMSVCLPFVSDYVCLFDVWMCEDARLCESFWVKTCWTLCVCVCVCSWLCFVSVLSVSDSKPHLFREGACLADASWLSCSWQTGRQPHVCVLFQNGGDCWCLKEIRACLCLIYAACLFDIDHER